MDAFELLKGWPGWSNANSERVLASPAWRMNVEYDGESAEMTCASDGSDDLLWLEVGFDDDRNLLGVADSEGMPELHRVWGVRDGLPPEILLVLAERECGALFQMLENATDKTFSLKGVADAAAVDTRKKRMFVVRPQGADAPVCAFALEMSPAVSVSFGRIRNLDTGHPSVREMTIAAVAEYFSFELSESELGRLAVGDFLLCGEMPSAEWRYGSGPRPGLRAVDAQPGRLTFGQIADGELPPARDPGLLYLVKDGNTVAEGVFDRVAGAVAIRITKLGNKG